MTFYEALILAQNKAQKQAAVDGDSMFFVIENHGQYLPQPYFCIPEYTYERFLNVDFTVDDRAAAVWSDGVLIEVDGLLV